MLGLQGGVGEPVGRVGDLVGVRAVEVEARNGTQLCLVTSNHSLSRHDALYGVPLKQMKNPVLELGSAIISCVIKLAR